MPNIYSCISLELLYSKYTAFKISYFRNMVVKRHVKTSHRPLPVANVGCKISFGKLLPSIAGLLLVNESLLSILGSSLPISGLSLNSLPEDQDELNCGSSSVRSFSSSLTSFSHSFSALKETH